MNVVAVRISELFLKHNIKTIIEECRKIMRVLSFKHFLNALIFSKEIVD